MTYFRLKKSLILALSSEPMVITTMNIPLKLSDCLLFYRDGILLYGSSFPINELDRHETMYRNGEHYNFSKGLKDSWGVFKIDGNKILFERWYPSQPPLKAFVGSGIILNDTTFRITEYYRMQGGQKTNIESSSEIYHFKAFSPKTDSTNNFVK